MENDWVIRVGVSYDEAGGWRRRPPCVTDRILAYAPTGWTR